MDRPSAFVSLFAVASLWGGVAAWAQTPPAPPSPSATPSAPSAPPVAQPSSPTSPGDTGGRRRPGSALGPGMMFGPAMGGPGGFGRMCEPRAAGLGVWRMNQIERAVTLTDAQKAALDKLRDSSAKAAEIIAAGCPTERPLTAPGRLEAVEKRLTAMAQGITTLRPAFDAFYATLNDEQKARVDSLGPPRRGDRWRWRWHWRDRDRDR